MALDDILTLTVICGIAILAYRGTRRRDADQDAQINDGKVSATTWFVAGMGATSIICVGIAYYFFAYVLSATRNTILMTERIMEDIGNASLGSLESAEL